MGVSIHYSGRITDKDKLPQLIDEVEEIASVHNWKYNIYERRFPENKITSTIDSISSSGQHDGKLYGIDFTPEGSEPVSICFLSNGRMSSIMQLFCRGEFKEEKTIVISSANVTDQGELEIQQKEETLTAADYNKFLCMCSTKTQYAGSEMHAMIIGVLRYVSKQYLSDFNLVDESQFWETNDKVLLKENFARNAAIIEGFGCVLAENQRLADEDWDSYIQRIIKAFRSKEGQ